MLCCAVQAKKEGNAEVVAQLEAALRAAFEVKQATLRPEIQLLNRLLAAEGEEQRRQVRCGASRRAGQNICRQGVGWLVPETLHVALSGSLRTALEVILDGSCAAPGWQPVLVASLSCRTAPSQVLAAPGAVDQLVMNDRYFFGLLERMLADVQRQPEGQQRTELLQKLQAIQADAEQRAAAAAQ